MTELHVEGERDGWPPESIFPSLGLAPEEEAIIPRAGTFRTSDGYPLATLSWPASSGPAATRWTIVVLHGVQSHAGWYHGLGRRLAAAGHDAIFPDRRGSGANRPARGHAPSAGRLIADIAEIALDVRRSHPGRPIALAGISWGGKLVVAAAARHPELFDALALICPGLTPRVGVSRRERLGIASAVLTGRAARVTFPIPLADPTLFTANPAAQAFIAGDPLSLRRATAGLLATSFFLDRRVRKARGRIRQPSLLMLAEGDRIIDNARTRAYFEGIPAPRKRVIAYPDGQHTLEFDPDPALYARDLVDWLRECSEAPRPH